MCRLQVTGDRARVTPLSLSGTEERRGSCFLIEAWLPASDAVSCASGLRLCVRQGVTANAEFGFLAEGPQGPRHRHRSRHHRGESGLRFGLHVLGDQGPGVSGAARWPLSRAPPHSSGGCWRSVASLGLWLRHHRVSLCAHMSSLCASLCPDLSLLMTAPAVTTEGPANCSRTPWSIRLHLQSPSLHTLGQQPHRPAGGHSSATHRDLGHRE